MTNKFRRNLDENKLEWENYLDIRNEIKRCYATIDKAYATIDKAIEMAEFYHKHAWEWDEEALKCDAGSRACVFLEDLNK